MSRYSMRAGLVALVVATSACVDLEKNAVQDITGPVPAARVRFFNFGVCGATQTTTTSCMPSVNFYANDTKITAVSSTTGQESTAGVAFGGVGLAGLYSGIEPGQYTLSGRISATVDKDLPVATLNTTLADGKAYSFFISGFYNTTTKTADAFIVEDPIPANMDWSVAYVRWVHAISNANPLQLFVTHTDSNVETAVGSVIPYKGATQFVAVAPGVYNLATRLTGSSTNAIARTGVSLVAGRVYTIAGRGDITITSTTAINRPFLDFTANR